MCHSCASAFCFTPKRCISASGQENYYFVCARFQTEITCTASWFYAEGISDRLKCHTCKILHEDAVEPSLVDGNR